MQSSHMHRHTFEGLFAPQPRTHDAERTQRSRPHRGTGVADPSDLAGSSRKGRASPGRDPHSWSTWAIGCCRSGPAGWRCTVDLLVVHGYEAFAPRRPTNRSSRAIPSVDWTLRYRGIVPKYLALECGSRQAFDFIRGRKESNLGSAD